MRSSNLRDARLAGLKITISKGHDSASAATKIAMLRTAHSKVSHVRDWVSFYRREMMEGLT
jgi:hypothetical protein